MPFSIFRFPDFQSILLPNNVFAWIALILLVGSLTWVIWKEMPDWRAWGKSQWSMAALLFSASLLLPSLFIIKLPVANALPIPGLATPSFGPNLPLLVVLPWLLAAVFLGVFPGAIMALASGLLIASWDTRSVFTPAEFALIAFSFSWLIKQNYRSTIFLWLRKPWLAALLLAILYPIINLINAFLLTAADFSLAVDFSLSRLPWSSLAVSLPLIIGGLIISGISARYPQLVPRVPHFRRPPNEGSIQARVFSALLPIAFLLFISLATLTWLVAGQASRQSLHEQLQKSAEIASQAIPFMLETGQNQILQIANDPNLQLSNSSQLSIFLEQKLQQVPYFEQLVVVSQNLETISAFPVPDFEGIQPSELEIEAINRAFNGVPIQSLSVPPLSTESRGAQLSYIAAISAGNEIEAVLLGRSQIESNLFAQAMIQSLELHSQDGGLGQLWNAQGQIVFDTLGGALLGSSVEIPPLGVSELIDVDGIRKIQVYLLSPGSDWSVLIQIPSRLTQELALSIALPQLALILLLGGLTFLWLRISLTRVSDSLEEILGESRRYSNNEGAIDTASKKEGDEISRLSGAFDEMRGKQLAELKANNIFMEASMAVAQDHDIHRQMALIIEAALDKQASSVRIILQDQSTEKISEWGGGNRNKAYRKIDNQIIDLIGKQRRVLLTNPARTPLDFGKLQTPSAVAIFVLGDKSENIGTLWMTFDRPQKFENKDVRYYEKLSTLAGFALRKRKQHSLLEDANARAQSVLKATKDPVIIFDRNQIILFANEAAREMSQSLRSNMSGMHLTEIEEIANIDLSGEEEINISQLSNGRSFAIQIVNLKSENSEIGKALILRDTTQQKQAEALRSEFLSTVSHELQDPIELLRGYLTMLDVMGDLNEKQSAYTSKIAESVDNMSFLVKNLFDLERVESDLGLQISKVSTAEIVNELVDEIRPKAKQKKVSLDLIINEGADTKIELDRTLIKRAILNLMDNAIRYSPRREKVRLIVERDKERIRITVTDKGTGIAPVDLPHVFERLRHKSGLESKQRGGLGLSIVKSIVERHGGKVWAESQLGQQSSFYLELPLEQSKTREAKKLIDRAL